MLKHPLVSLSLALGLALAAATPSLAQDLPPVPEAIKKQGVLRVGVKCDYPPDGYLDAQASLRVSRSVSPSRSPRTRSEAPTRSSSPA